MEHTRTIIVYVILYFKILNQYLNQYFNGALFTSKAHNGVFPTMIGFVIIGHLLFMGIMQKRWPRVTKPIMVGKTPCKLLCVFKVKVCYKWLVCLSFKLLIHLQTSWPYLLSELLVAGSSWPRTFLYHRCFCLAYHYFLSTNDTITVATL